MVTIKIGGMGCGGCVSSISDALNKVDGVGETEISLENGSANVEFEPSLVSLEQIVQAIVNIGFEATISEA